MRTGLSEQELLGLFEEVYDNEDKSRDLKLQIKAIATDSAERFKEFAKDAETNIKDLKAAYKYWKEHQDGEASDNEDFFTMITMIDNLLENEE